MTHPERGLECRRRAPTLELQALLTDVEVAERRWPLVFTTDWCGEYARHWLDP